MKIISVETILLRLPYESGGATRLIGGQPTNMLDMLLIRIDTDDGLTGWGEAFGHAAVRSTKTALDTMIAPMLIGRDPADIAGLMLDLQRNLHIFGRNGPVSYGLSGVDIALWDLAGKRAGLPLYQLLGGAPRERLTAYASLRRYGDATIVAANAQAAVARGYRSIKIHEIVLENIRAVRAAIGPDIRLFLDTNCPWTVTEALANAIALRPYDIALFEEPIWPPEDYQGLACIRAAGVATAAGENISGFYHFKRLFEAKAVSVVQPSVTKVGGITEMLEILALAKSFDVEVMPHCGYFGPGYLAVLHITGAMQGDVLFERLYLDLKESPFSPWTEAQDGSVGIPQAPGLGCDPDMAVVERYRVNPPRVTR
jgi:L-alanine-DL-glutamate epimerase-like enolase superfamily enzyme